MYRKTNIMHAHTNLAVGSDHDLTVANGIYFQMATEPNTNHKLLLVISIAESNDTSILSKIWREEGYEESQATKESNGEYREFHDATSPQAMCSGSLSPRHGASSGCG